MYISHTFIIRTFNLYNICGSELIAGACEKHTEIYGLCVP